MNKIFKQHFKSFFKNIIGMDEKFIEGVNKCDTELKLAEYMAVWGEEIAEAIGVDLYKDCEECEEKDKEISEAGDYACELEHKLEKFPEFKTLDEDRKLEAFMEHHHKYNATEMDELLK